MEEKIKCSFCKKTKNQVNKLIAGKNQVGSITFICDKCTTTCYLALQKTLKNTTKMEIDFLTPHEIYEELSLVVEGQEEVKKTLSTCIYNHYQRINNDDDEEPIAKSNILCVGKSGCGKTLAIKTAAEVLGVPFAVVDASSFTASGYSGADVSSMFIPLIKNADFDIQKAENGIIFIDEIDKIMATGAENDVSGKEVQKEILRMLEDGEGQVSFNPNRKNHDDIKMIKTANITFICGGVFDGLQEIIERDLRSSVGFLTKEKKEMTYKQIMKHLTTEHLIKYGFIPELLGRLHINIIFDELTEENLMNILVRPKNAILKQYVRLLRKDNVNLKWNSEILKYIAHEASKGKVGARGLRSMVDNALLPLMFDIPTIMKTKKSMDLMMYIDESDKLTAKLLDIDSNEEYESNKIIEKNA